jgi:AcrR family transcriptional regulator
MGTYPLRKFLLHPIGLLTQIFLDIFANYVNNRQKGLIMRIRRKEEVILKAAARTFAKKGFHRTKVSDIVKGAGIARGTFYLYYKSKTELFEKLLDELMTQVIKNFADIDYHILNTQEDFYKHVLKVSQRFKDLVLKNRDLASIFLKEIGMVGGKFQKKLESYHKGLMEISKEFLNYCHNKGIIRKVNPEVISYVASGIVRELLSRFLNGQIEADVDEIIEEGVRLYVNGLVKK